MNPDLAACGLDGLAEAQGQRDPARTQRALQLTARAGT